MTNNKYCLIFSLIDPWDTNPRKPSTIAYADELNSSFTKFLCIEPSIFSFYTLFKYPSRILKYIKGKYKFRKVYDNIYTFCPFTIEHLYIIDKVPLIKIINLWLLKNQILNKLKRIGVTQDRIIFVLHRPELHFFKKIFKDSKIIYECQDDFLSTPTQNYSKVRGNLLREQNFVEDCDFVLATAEKLYTRFIEINKNTYLLENGFSDKLFKNNIKIKPKNVKLIAGYIGHIRNWIDFELIEYIVSKNPDVIFKFSGNIQKQVNVVFNNMKNKYKNIVYRSNISYDDYPNELSGFDVGLIPFRMNDFMSCSNPNKLYEYFGAGLPVISTDIGDIQKKYSEYTFVASSFEEFDKHLHTLKNMSNDDYITLRKKIQHMSVVHTWENNAKVFVELLNSLINVN